MKRLNLVVLVLVIVPLATIIVASATEGEDYNNPTYVNGLPPEDLVSAIEQGKISNFAVVNDARLLSALTKKTELLDKANVFVELNNRVQRTPEILNTNPEVKARWFKDYGITDQGARVQEFDGTKVVLKGTAGVTISNIKDVTKLAGAIVTENGELILKDKTKVGENAIVSFQEGSITVEGGRVDLADTSGIDLQIKGSVVIYRNGEKSRTIVSDKGITYRSSSICDVTKTCIQDRGGRMIVSVKDDSKIEVELHDKSVNSFIVGEIKDKSSVVLRDNKQVRVTFSSELPTIIGNPNDLSVKNIETVFTNKDGETKKYQLVEGKSKIDDVPVGDSFNGKSEVFPNGGEREEDVEPKLVIGDTEIKPGTKFKFVDGDLGPNEEEEFHFTEDGKIKKKSIFQIGGVVKNGKKGRSGEVVRWFDISKEELLDSRTDIGGDEVASLVIEGRKPMKITPTVKIILQQPPRVRTLAPITSTIYKPSQPLGPHKIYYHQTYKAANTIVYSDENGIPIGISRDNGNSIQGYSGLRNAERVLEADLREILAEETLKARNREPKFYGGDVATAEEVEKYDGGSTEQNYEIETEEETFPYIPENDEVETYPYTREETPAPRRINYTILNSS
jgi:hypothetical protein